MATQILKNAFVSINGVDLSDHVRSVTFNYSAEQQDDSAMSIDTRTTKPGLYNWSIEVEFNQDYAASKVDATLFSLVGAAAFPLILRPDAGAVAVTNPQFTGNAVLESYTPLQGAVGDMHIANATFQAAGDIARATS
jgi:hypothetical protein